jgi:SAM-dependent methyltransferase
MARLPWQEDRYRDLFGAGTSDLLAGIWRDAYADDYPEEAEPFGFVTKADLGALVDALKIDGTATLLDVGCGRGGPGLWIARETGCTLIGLDILAEAIAHADRLAARFGRTGRAKFAVGTFTDTGLPDASVDAIMSVDAFWMVLDKAGALREMARVLRAGGRFAMTTWIPAYMDVKALLHPAGFDPLSIHETAGWKARQLAVYEGILRHRHELPGAIGAAAAEVMIAEAEQAPVNLAAAPRCLVVARRRV